MIFIAVKPLDRAVVDFAAPRGACEMMITVVITLDSKQRSKRLKPRELDTRLAAEADHLKIVPVVQMGASFRRALGILKV